MIVPKNRPQLSGAEARKILKEKGVLAPLAILGFRGYYKRTLGDPTKNDRKLYDDAIIVVTPERIVAFNANVDPAGFGRLIGRQKALASLQPGVWKYKKGRHKARSPLGYMALTQYSVVTVKRDDGKVESGYFGINIHRGGFLNTSSEGCQTIYPKQWEEFKSLVYAEMTRSGLNFVEYVLVEE